MKYQTIPNPSPSLIPEKKPDSRGKWCFLLILSLILPLVFLLLLGLMSPGLWQKLMHPSENQPKNQDYPCSLQLVESIPDGLVYNSSIVNMKTFQAWNMLLDNVESKLEIASSYWSLRGKDIYEHPSDWQGERIYQRLVKATERGILIDIAQNLQPNKDTEDLSKLKGVRVKSLDFPKLMGGGILHTKLWIADRKHFYVGSANFDWRSLTQVKEIGILALNCSCLTDDMAKIWEVYWDLGGKNKQIPPRWPNKYDTDINFESPLSIKNTNPSSGNEDLEVFLSSSPPPFCPYGREVDINAIVKLVAESKKFIYIAVMDYFPSFLYAKGRSFWPVIDDALRSAAINRKVHIRLLLSDWNHTHPDMKFYFQSLLALNGLHKGQVKVEGKWFKVDFVAQHVSKFVYVRKR